MTAFARATDPHTSWEAAESLSDDTVRASQQIVLSYVRNVGRAYSIEIENALHAPVPGRSRARIRTAISELRKLGHLQVAGYGRPPGAARRTMILQPTRKEERCESDQSNPNSGPHEPSATSHGMHDSSSKDSNPTSMTTGQGGGTSS